MSKQDHNLPPPGANAAPEQEQIESIIHTGVLEDPQFIEATFQGARRGASIPWPRVIVRPVTLRGMRHWQFIYSDGKQETAKNFDRNAAGGPLQDLLKAPFKSIRVRSATGSVRVQFTKRGRPILHQDKHPVQRIELDLAHDRSKPGLLSEEDPPPFLRAIGVVTGDGRVRADQRRKFRQINEFLRLIDETGEIERMDSRPLRVVDLGCGSAALTFATYHYLNNLKGIPTTVLGVDAKAYLMERHRQTAGVLGWDGMEFVAARIADFEIPYRPDLVLALHACDTATDEALARAISWRSQMVLSAPCCHHHLQAQLAASDTPEAFRPVLRHGILRERLGDILTDSFRAIILRLMGYRTDVLEFIAVEHTPKNLMIRALLRDATLPPAAMVAEYNALKAYWGVTPYLETLIAEQLLPVVGDAKV